MLLIYIMIMDQKQFTDEVIKLKKEIFELRLKKATRQNVKPHLFKITKYRLARLLTLQTKTMLK
uniref:Large ribosomal subunit protein uL29c n=1 Tax=Hildenbrandia rubra TaxID=31481 RepID=A0A1C9CGB8_9FLOR|nr:ribosomal protein L29 [Hildenbrandia rubra]AOM67426.1 ribosomal protein L29 [Hildenbrandia rubra]